MATLDLGGLEGRLVGTFSGGQLARADLAVALLANSARRRPSAVLGRAGAGGRANGRGQGQPQRDRRGHRDRIAGE